MKRYSSLIIILLLTGFGLNAQENSASVFNANRGGEKKWVSYKNNNEALYNIITNEAFTLLEERAANVAKIETAGEWKNYQTDLKEKIFASLNKFEKTPLNIRVTGKIKRDNFTVEKVMFESHPNFFVTGCLFIPKKRQKPAPAIIYASGHTELAFRSETYQHVILNLVEKGFVVFGMDPIGQGERLQYLDSETGKSKIGSSTKEHTFAGVQTLLTGISLSDYFIWDGVRTIDFLLTRKEVDPERIGITGRSGGGTQSAMIAAYDDRIYASAPECYITTFKRLLQSIGPQDAEQNIYNAIKLGFDHPDYLHLRAPKPSLIITTTHDFFSQQGARESYREAQKSYSALGNPENIEFVEDFGKHESTKNNREAMYSFFQKSLNNPGDKTDVDVEFFKPEELWVTPTGQLRSAEIGCTTFDLNQKYFSKVDLTEKDLKNKIKELSGMNFNRKLTAAVYTGKYKSEKRVVEKYFLENDKNDFALPVYLLKNENQNSGKVLIWLTPGGKSKFLENEQLGFYIKKGYTIVSADLPGTGELFDSEFTGDGFVNGVPFNYTFGAHLVGKSVPGIQAEAIDLLTQFVKTEYGDASLDAVIEGEISTAVLFYASQKYRFNNIEFKRPLQFDSKFIKTEYYNPNDAYHIVPGSLKYFSFDEVGKRLKILNLEKK